MEYPPPPLRPPPHAVPTHCLPLPSSPLRSLALLLPCSSQVKDNNLNPLWNPLVIRGTQLNNGDPMRPLCLRVYDFERNGKHRLLGEAQTTGKGLKEALGESLPCSRRGWGGGGP